MFDEQCFVMWPNGQTLCLTSKCQMFDQQCLILFAHKAGSIADLTPRTNRQTLFVKHWKFALQTMFDRLATSQNIAWQAKFLQ